MVLLIFIPVLIGSIIGMAFILMLLARCGGLALDKPTLLNRVAQMLSAGNKEKAIIALEEDNHPISNLLSFMLSLSIKDEVEQKQAYEYAREEMRIRLTRGTSMLAWLTLTIPIATVAIWFIMPVKPPPALNMILIWALVIEIVFWNTTLFYIKLKTLNMLRRCDDHYRFFSGLFMSVQGEGKLEGRNVDIEGLVEETKDIVDVMLMLKKKRQEEKDAAL